jgi:serine protease Do
MHRFKTAFRGLLTAGLMTGGMSVLAADSPALSLARQLNEAFIEVADKVSTAVVVIEVTEKVREDDESWWGLLAPEERPRHRFHHRDSQPEAVEGEGSGVIVSEDGYILTNDHVVENADKIVVRFKDGRTFDAEVKGSDPLSDIAVIKIKARGLTPAKLGDSDTTRVGEFVLAIGAPFALSYSVTFGHVSAKGRSFEGQNLVYSDRGFIQTDASINPGNSGGPLVNLYGEVIAINTMIEGMNTGIGFAVPINLAKLVKDRLIADGKLTRSWIGVGILELKDYLAYRNLDKQFAPDAETGIVITEIVADGPASKSGLRARDVIVAVEGKTVESARQLKDVVALEKPGQVLTLNVVRAREHLAIKVQTAAYPADEQLAETGQSSDEGAAQQQPQASAFGLNVEAMTEDLADRYGVKPGSGVIVTLVERDSPADESGIKPGDVITEINRQPVTNRRQFRQALRTADAKKGITVNVINKGSSRLVILKESGQ